ncbi:unnamed protein product [Caenorhabditis brenneri]
MKEVCFKDEESKKQVENEFNIHHNLTKIGHANIIKMCKINRYEASCRLYMEFADGGELGGKIGEDGMDLEMAKFYFRQIVEGLSFLHSNGVVHRDIKPQNLLLTKSGVIKIADFGLSKRYRNESGEEILMDYACGTPPYYAPELFKPEPFRGPPADVWSAGIVMVLMITGMRPWEMATEYSIPYLLWKNGLKRDPWTSMDDNTINFIKRILTEKVEDRATIEQIKNDPWLAPENLPTLSLKRKTIENENSGGQQKEHVKRERLEHSDTSSEA